MCLYTSMSVLDTADEISSILISAAWRRYAVLSESTSSFEIIQPFSDLKDFDDEKYAYSLIFQRTTQDYH